LDLADLPRIMRDTVASGDRTAFHDTLRHCQRTWHLRGWLVFTLGRDWYAALWQEWESRFTGEIPRTYAGRDSLGWFLGTQCGDYDCDEFESVAGPL
jgi:hypothetical protein